MIEGGHLLMAITPLSERLVEKSIESFLMAIEVYNKPTIRYRVEGFSMFVCNAWELLLKARLITTKGEQSIYYSDNPDRTISLENCVRLIFTNKKQPLRLNIEKINELRNISTHFITEEYEMVYVPLFQACVFNYTQKLQDFFDIDISKRIPQNFLTLSSSMRPLDAQEVRAKYPIELANRIIAANNTISSLAAENNSAFAIRIDHRHYITKDKSEADSLVSVSKDATTDAVILREIKDPSNTHGYTAKACISAINSRLKSDGYEITINMYHFGLFDKYYGIKANERFCYTYMVTSQPLYSYSILVIDFIVREIEKDPAHILQNLKKYVDKKKS